MALADTVQWDVRTTGSDTNGGAFDPGVASPGTDYSQQPAAQIAYTDLVIGSTVTQLSSAANPFTAADVGNTLNITGGTGFTTGRYTVASVAAGVAAMDRAVGTAASTGGAGNLGGSLATIGAANAACVAGNTVNIQAGTYTQTASIAIPVNTVTWTGYNSTHGDNGTKPLITTATNGVALINTGSSTNGIQEFNNLSLSNTAGSRASGIWQLNAHGSGQWWVFNNCVFDGFATAIDNSNDTPDDVAVVIANGCEIKNSTASGFNNGDSTQNVFTMFSGCYFHGNASNHALVGNGTNNFYRCIFGPGSIGINCKAVPVIVESCTFFGLTSTALSPSVTMPALTVVNCLFYGNDYAVSTSGSASITNSNLASRNNAFGGNTNPNVGWPVTAYDVTLTANPFTASGSGDFSLNSAAGGGASCKGAGFIQSFPGASFASSPDIGAVQSAGAGGGSAGVSYACS